MPVRQPAATVPIVTRRSYTMGIATHHAMRALHLTDTVTTCDCCGRANLKATVLMLRDDGGTAHYGRTCAARNSGKTSKQIQVEIYAEEARQQQRQRKMQANAEALEAFNADDMNHSGLQIQRRNYHQLGGAQVLGRFPDWLAARAAETV